MHFRIAGNQRAVCHCCSVELPNKQYSNSNREIAALQFTSNCGKKVQRAGSFLFSLLFSEQFGIYLLPQVQSIRAFCEQLLENNSKVLSTITINYESVAKILNNIEGVVIGSTCGQHERMKRLYIYWDKIYSDALIK